MKTSSTGVKTRTSPKLAAVEHGSLAAAVEHAADGILMTDISGTIQYVNPSFTAMTGYSSEEALGRKPSMLKSGLHPAALYKEMWATIRSGHVWRGELTNRRKDGTTYQEESRISPVHDASGEISGYVAIKRDITERKRSEQARQFQLSLIRTIQEGSLDGILVVNKENRIVSFNKKYFDIWRVPLSSVLDGPFDIEKGIPSLPVLSLVADCVKDREAFLKQVQELAADDAASNQYEIELKDGRTLERYSTSLLSENGEYLARAWFCRDITGRKREEQALQNSEEKFRQLTENIREIFWLKTPEADDYLYVSPAYEQVFGRTCASFCQNPASRLEAIHPGDLEQHNLVFARQMRGEDAETQFRIRTPDGQEKWVRSRAFPIRDRSGRLVRIAGITEDITDHKRHEGELIRARDDAEDANRRLSAQHAILDNERKILRTFIDNVPDFMYVKDLESRFVIANKVVAEWAGVEKPEDILGKTDFDLCPREMAMKFYQDEQHIMRTREPSFDLEEKVTTGTTNENLYLLTTKVPLFDSEGNVAGIAGIGRDITMRKAMEDAVSESNRELQEASDWANKLALEAEAASRAKSEFLANMSHEIRTPMNGVLGMNGLLLGTNLDAEQRHYAEVVDASAKSLLCLIDDILDFSKVEAGKLEIDCVDFSLNVLMGDFAELMAERVKDKPVEFVCAVDPRVCNFLQGDPGRLRQILMNLVGNAMKFTRQGEVVVRVNQISETDCEVVLRFAVRDTGIGIPKDKQKILFSSFTQVDASTTRQFGGTGLGLAISKKLAELMGGEIGMDSKEGDGSEFWFTVRLSKQLACVHAEPPTVHVEGTRILVVDDNATNREVLTAQLQAWGAVVVAVESGSSALSCLRYAVAAGNPFQLAVLDMMMPGMDGATLGSAILADDSLNATPLVMMTSIGQRGDAIRIKQIGFAAYLVKPVRPSDLLDCLVAVLAGEQQAEKRTLITRHSLEAARRSNARILLVEDNATNQEVASGMLRRLGWHADVTADGKQAIEALQTNTYDLVLMDVQMPEMDGYEATRIIRDPASKVLNHNIPIIATTAHAMAGDEEKCLAAGMSDYIPKPIDPKTLSKVVDKWLRRKVHAVPAVTAIESAGENKATPTPPAQTPPTVSLVFNREAFLTRMMGDKEFALEIVAGFVKELPALLTSIEEQAALGALEPVWKHAHKIKGSAANVGGEALSEVAAEIEQAGKAGDLARVVNSIPELKLQVSRLSDALQQWMN